MILSNTTAFTEEARKFDREGSYCRFPKGSYAHREYWEEMNRRCMEGFSVGDLWIPGTYYFYLNFNKILSKDELTNRKKLNFPRFTDVDLEYFSKVDQARKEKKGLIVLK